MTPKLETTVAFRVSAAQKRLMEAEARAVGLRLGDWCRRVIEARISFPGDSHEPSSVCPILQIQEVEDDDGDE